MRTTASCQSGVQQLPEVAAERLATISGLLTYERRDHEYGYTCSELSEMKVHDKQVPIRFDTADSNLGPDSVTQCGPD